MSPSNNSLLTLCALVALAVSTPASAASRGAAEAHQRYLDDRAACLSGKTGEDRKTCLREAGAAQDAARRGKLTDAQAGYEQNQLARCAYYRDADDRKYCERRMRGEGTTTGSVEAGGILRQLVVPVPAD